MENNEVYSCLDCIWHDQCEDEKSCEFFDRGQIQVSDEELESQIESGRIKYRNEYAKYANEYGDR